MTRCLLVLICCVGLSGCAAFTQPWPGNGTGGFAEWRPIYDSHASDLDQRLEAARDHGAERFAAGAFADAELLLTRCRRELEAGLSLDAGADLDRLEVETAKIEAVLARANSAPLPRAS